MQRKQRVPIPPIRASNLVLFSAMRKVVLIAKRLPKKNANNRIQYHLVIKTFVIDAYMNKAAPIPNEQRKIRT